MSKSIQAVPYERFGMRNSSFPRFEESPIAFDDLPSAADLKLAADANKNIWDSETPIIPIHKTVAPGGGQPSCDMTLFTKECLGNESSIRR